MRQQFLERSYAQSQRLTSLLQDISTLNRMDDAPEITTQEHVDIANMVANIQKETALQLQEKHMTFVNRLPADLVICGNGSLVYSIFRNLTDNAIAYAGIGTTITLTAQLVQTNIEDNGKWHFCFSDNGVGWLPNTCSASSSASIVWTRVARARWVAPDWASPS